MNSAEFVIQEIQASLKMFRKLKWELSSPNMIPSMVMVIIEVLASGARKFIFLYSESSSFMLSYFVESTCVCEINKFTL